MARYLFAMGVFFLLVMSGASGALPVPGPSSDVDIEGTRWPGPLVGPAAIGSGPSTIWLRAGVFDPVTDGLPRVLDLVDTSSEGVYLVQFRGTLSPELGGRLAAVGARVLGYVPEDGLVVRLPRPSVALSMASWKDVRWLGPWLDGWKLHPYLAVASGPTTLSVIGWPGSGDLSEDLRDAGCRVLGRLHEHHLVEARASMSGQLSAIAGVSWIEPWSAPDMAMDHATRSSGARQDQDGPFDAEGTAAWSYNPATDDFEGTTGGANQITIAVTDSGVDSTHPAFNGRRDGWSAIEPGRPPWTDPSGHGTHVAGIALGDGSYRTGESGTLPDGKYAGIAPEARLLAQSLWGEGITYFYRNITQWSSERGAHISQNSWGEGNWTLWGNYTAGSYDYDNSTRDADWMLPGNQSLLVVFSAGNWGYNGSAFFNYTITPPGTAKNVITVGAVGNDKGFLTPDEMMLQSSRGPCDDGRIKPDLVAPGYNVTSAWAMDDNGAGGYLPPDGGTHSYIGYDGTSLSAPLVSGAAALVMDHLLSKEGATEPSPALVKSILIASADHLPGMQWPSNEQGWGRLNVTKAIVGSRTSNTVWIDQTTKLSSAGQTISYRFDVAAGTPVTFSLVWTDLPSSIYVGKNLVNDLDLEVKSPSGTVYKGNRFSGGQSVAGGVADHTNNVELAYLEAPEAGEWEVTVRCHELPPLTSGGVQDFALAVVGNVDKKYIDLRAENLSVRATDAAEGEVIPIAFDLANLGNLMSTAVPWRLNLLDATGLLHSRIDSGIVETIGPRKGVRIYANWTAVRGTWTIQVVPNPTLSIREESYQNNNASKTFLIKGFGVEGEVKIPLKAGRPGSDVTFNMNITNTGNVPDRFLLERSEPPPGWDARLDTTFLNIPSGATKSANLIVTIGEGAVGGFDAPVNVTVVSQGNSTYSITLVTRTQVKEVFDASIVLDHITQDATPGENASFSFTIRNLGNAPDTYRVSFRQGSGPEEGVSFDLPRGTFTTQMGDEVTGDFRVLLDAGRAQDLAVGEKITFRLELTSVNDEFLVRTADGSVVIRQLHKVSVVPPIQEEILVLPGDDTPVLVELSNDGNGVDQVSPGLVVPQDWEWMSQPTMLSMSPGEMKSFQLFITTPLNANAGQYTITVQSIVDGTVMDERELVFVVDFVPGVRVWLNGPWDNNLTQGSELVLQFRVTNTGNRADQVAMEFGGLSRGLTARASPDTADLGVGGSADIFVTFTAAEDAELMKGSYRVIFAHAEGVERKTVTVNITIELKPNGGGGGGGEDDGGGGLTSTIIVAIAIAVLVAVVVISLLAMGRSRREAHRLEERFFVDRDSGTTAQVLEEERSARRAPPPSGEEGWEEAAPSRRVPPPPTAMDMGATPVAAPASSASCPDCGNTLQPLAPGSAGMYCPMCGYKREGE